MTTFDFVPARGVAFRATESGLHIDSAYGQRQLKTSPIVASTLARIDGRPLA